MELRPWKMRPRPQRKMLPTETRSSFEPAEKTKTSTKLKSMRAAVFRNSILVVLSKGFEEEV